MWEKHSERVCVCVLEGGGRADYIKPLDFMQKEMSSGNVPVIIESSDLNRCLYSSGHSSIFHNSRKMETMQMSTRG